MMAIGEAARISGVNIETIRYYEREGIVPPPARAENNRRVYSDTDVGRLSFLKKCRDLGFPLNEAKTLLGLSEQEDGQCQSVKRLADEQIASVRSKIAELTRLEAALQEISSNCHNGNTDCPMLDALQRS